MRLETLSDLSMLLLAFDFGDEGPLTEELFIPVRQPYNTIIIIIIIIIIDKNQSINQSINQSTLIDFKK